ncbi:MAG: hypothetical protein GY777_17125 [Candidatus Brocadiaceae bacterium]|nr:hypothetical protein [Candidatus Brocadiaceae bacterium]
MGTSIEEKKISDMTGKELKTLIKDTVLELIDPDYELELRTDVEEELNDSLRSTRRITAEEVAKDLGIEW